MGIFKDWTARQRHAVIAAYLAWSLDAFDFFVMVFVFPDIAARFGVPVPKVALAVVLTLAFRALGAFLFGRLADRYGRKPVLMVNVALYSLFGFLTAFSPSLGVFLVIRSLFGVAMGGVWGIGASLAFETIAPAKRGFVSGLMQSGYPTGYLFAALAFGPLYALVGWQGMFMIGVIPALLLILYIGMAVEESPGWNAQRARASGTLSVLASHWKVALYAILLMTAFNFFSHGTQDIYPLFLQKQHGFDHDTVSHIAVIYNVGALLGGLIFGSLSQHLGRRRTAITAALLSLPVAALWAAPLAILAHGLGEDPVFFFANRAALAAFETTVPAITTMPSRFPDAVLRAGRLGRGAGASERIVAPRCARHFSGHGVPAWKSHCLGQCLSADQSGGDQWRQLRHGAGGGGGDGGAGDRAGDEAGAGSKRRFHGLIRANT